MNIKERLLTRLVWLVICVPFGALLLHMKRAGRLRITNWEQVRSGVMGDGVLILTNHPSYFETSFFQKMLFKEIWQDLEKNFIHTTPADDLYPFPFRWFYTGSRGIAVSRQGDRALNRQAIRQLMHVFSRRESAVINGEGGRTYSRNLTSDFLINGDRTMRVWTKNIDAILKLAYRQKMTIQPVWFDIPCWKEKNGFRNVWWHWLTSDMVITIHVGNTLPPNKLYSRTEVEQAVLTA